MVTLRQQKTRYFRTKNDVIVGSFFFGDYLTILNGNLFMCFFKFYLNFNLIDSFRNRQHSLFTSFTIDLLR